MSGSMASKVRPEKTGNKGLDMCPDYCTSTSLRKGEIQEELKFGFSELRRQSWDSRETKVARVRRKENQRGGSCEERKS